MDNEFIQIPYCPHLEINRIGVIRNIITKKNITSYVNFKGYRMIGYRHNNTKNGVKNYRIHKLVALTFLPNPNNFPQINHINGIKADNRLENLEWCSAKENIQHAYKTGLVVRRIGETNPSAKLTNNNIKEIREKIKSGMVDKQIALSFNVSSRLICGIRNRKFWKHI